MSPQEIKPADALKQAEAQATTPIQEMPMPQVEGTYLIIKQTDGNYIGYTFKGGNAVDARQGDPQTVLTMLLTHDGTIN